MVKRNETVHLLILDESQNDAEQITSQLRNAGISTRAHRIQSDEGLSEALESQSWDLFLVREGCSEIEPVQAVKMVRQQDKDFPIIILTDTSDNDVLVEYMKNGAQDAVCFDHTKHVVLAVKRELHNLKERKRRRLLELQIHDAEQRCQLLLDSSRDAIAYINDGMHIYANPSYMEFLGYDDIDDLICIPVLDTLSSDSQEEFREFNKQFLEDEKITTTEKPLKCVSLRSDGNEIPIALSLSKATYDGEECMQIILQPQQNNAELEEKLKEIASQDLVTGLYNRQYFMEQLHKIRDLAIKDNTHSAVYYIALDDFFNIKSRIGMADIDIVIRDAAQELRTQASEGAILARLSDDVFGLIQPKQNGKEAMIEAAGLGKKIEEHLFEAGGKTLQLTVSIGINIVNESSPEPKDILGRAHTAADNVEDETGKKGNGARLYTPKIDNDLSDSEKGIAIIEDALENNKFKLLFQPIISLRGESEEHYEAFIRMLDDKGEEVSPYDFLPPGGPSTMASKIDRWVVLQTINNLSEHRSKGHDSKLFLNLTAETIQDKTFTSWLNVALQAARLPGDSLIFQIAEANAITYLKQAREFIRELKELRCKVSINQFGCALNPFNLLKHVDADYIKLDGSFTQDMQKDEEAKEHAKEMIKSLQTQGKLTIVPLVESASMLSVLWQAGVNYIQGYYLQAPTTEMNYDFSEES